MKGKTIFVIVSLLALSLGVSATSAAAQQEDPAAQQAELGTIYDVIQSDIRLESFEILVEAVGLADNLDDDGPFTVLAPTNEAWAAFEAMRRETDVTLTDILLYHVVNGEYDALKLRNSLPTLMGERLLLDAKDDAVVVNDTAKIISADIQASNGVVHVIDTVLSPSREHSLFASGLGSTEDTIPKVLAEDGRFETFLSLARQAGLMEMLENPNQNITLFVPSDEAFAALPLELLEEWMADPEGALRTILLFHLVGDQLSINQIATDDVIPTLEGRGLVVTTDENIRVHLHGRAIQSFNILAANGIIHVVDEVLMP